MDSIRNQKLCLTILLAFLMSTGGNSNADFTFGIPEDLGPTVNSSGIEGDPSISADGLSLFFTSNRPGGYGEWDIWVTTRATKDGPWGKPVNLGSIVNSSAFELAPSISADGSTLYFSSDQPGGIGIGSLRKVSIEPVVDLNGDGTVDSADMCILVDHWGENYSLCDIGPSPLGDGMVDVQDLVVLAEHLFEDVYDPTLIAHWALDEIEGATALDSVGGNDDLVTGGALWQPTDGVIDGALELDGVDDCIIAAFGPNPAEGPFSILAWIKGGAPGQVLVSEPVGSNWLLVDPEGKLMTELGGSGRGSGHLSSETIIAEGEWHRIGLAWDGSHRTLCVDGVVVAEDSQSDLEASGGGLYIGVGKDYAVGTFFSGLIDDIRIYDRAVKP